MTSICVDRVTTQFPNNGIVRYAAVLWIRRDWRRERAPVRRVSCVRGVENRYLKHQHDGTRNQCGDEFCTRRQVWRRTYGSTSGADHSNHVSKRRMWRVGSKNKRVNFPTRVVTITTGEELRKIIAGISTVKSRRRKPKNCGLD